MTFFWQQLRTPIKRERADFYMRWVLISFALSVVGTRVWLELTGYPQIGTETLHVGHVVWGGLLLFIATLFPLLMANRFALTASAILSGIGMGQFIDEVGKFITRTNDYFYAPALPIIYGFFLLTVLLYIRIRRPISHNSIKAEIFSVFDALEEIIENDLETGEMALLKKRLREIRKKVTDPNIERLVVSLLAVVEHDSFTTVQGSSEGWERIAEIVKRTQMRLFSRFFSRVFLICGYVSLGVVACVSAVQTGWAFVSETARTQLFQRLLESGDLLAQQKFGWFVFTTLLEGIIGFALIAAATMFVVKKDLRATQVGSLALILFLSSVNLLVLYFDQFQALITSVVFFLLYVLTRQYHRRFIGKNTELPLFD